MVATDHCMRPILLISKLHLVYIRQTGYARNHRLVNTYMKLYRDSAERKSVSRLNFVTNFSSMHCKCEEWSVRSISNGINRDRLSYNLMDVLSPHLSREAAIRIKSLRLPTAY